MGKYHAYGMGFPEVKPFLNIKNNHYKKNICAGLIFRSSENNYRKKVDFFSCKYPKATKLNTIQINVKFNLWCLFCKSIREGV